jgi:allophanate hydrolase subunit 2
MQHEPPVTLRVVPGPQVEAFTPEGHRTFLESLYRVTPHTDRMGCRLDGPSIAHRDGADILSDWVPLGGVQVPGSGKPIILLADRQTTGGYSKIATVIGPDLSRVAQCRPGDAVRFQAVSVEEAQGIARQFESALAHLSPDAVEADVWAELAGLGEVPGTTEAE